VLTCCVWIYERWNYLKELKGELQVVGVHRVDAVLSPPERIQGVAALRLRVAGLVAIGTDHTDLQSGGHFEPG